MEERDYSECAVTTNAYGDLCIPYAALPREGGAAAVAAFLDAELARCSRGAWLTLPFAAATLPLLGAAVAAGFSHVHHAYRNSLTLQAWRAPVARNPTPAYGHHACGAGALIVNAAGCVLGIRERFDRSGSWHPPGGHVDEGEDFVTAAVREAREETGVRVEPLGIVAFFEVPLPFVPPRAAWPHELTSEDRGKIAQSMRFGSMHLSAYVLCYACDDAIVRDAFEIDEARWLPAAEFAALAHEQSGAMVRALLAGGQIAAAAELARLEARCAAEGGDDAAGDRDAAPRESGGDAPAASAAAGGSCGRSHARIEAALEVCRRRPSWCSAAERACAGLIAGCAAQMRHKRFTGASFPTRYYTALEAATFIAGAGASPALVSARALTPALWGPLCAALERRGAAHAADATRSLRLTAAAAPEAARDAPGTMIGVAAACFAAGLVVGAALTIAAAARLSARR